MMPQRVGAGLLGSFGALLLGCSSIAPPDVRPLPGDPALRQATTDTPVAEADAPPPSLGMVLHRGQAYELRHLLDPAMRAASADPFVQEFEPDEMYAGLWGSALAEW